MTVKLLHKYQFQQYLCSNPFPQARAILCLAYTACLESVWTAWGLDNGQLSIFLKLPKSSLFLQNCVCGPTFLLDWRTSTYLLKEVIEIQCKLRPDFQEKKNSTVRIFQAQDFKTCYLAVQYLLIIWVVKISYKTF